MSRRGKKGLGSLRERKPGKWQFRFHGVANHPTELDVSDVVTVNCTFLAVSRTEAERIAAARITAALVASLHPEDNPMTTHQFFKSREAALLRGKASAVYRVMLLQGVERFCDWLKAHHPKLPILKVTRKHALAYMAWAMNKWKWRKATVRRNCTYLSQLWEVLIDEDRIDDGGNFWRTLPRRIYRRADLAAPKDSESRPKNVLTWARAGAILESLPAERRFLIDFLRRVPLRRTAFLQATVGDVRRDDDRDVWLLNVPRSKNKKARSIPLPNALHAGLLAWRAQFAGHSVGDHAPLFGRWADKKGWQRLYVTWQRQQRADGITIPMSLHNLRDLFAVAKRDAGVSWPVVSYLMGNDIRTAQAHYGYHVVADDAAAAMGC